LRALRADHSQWRSAQDTGQFSLAGAKPKTAVLFERQRCGCEVGSSSDHSRSQTTDRQMGRPGGERAFFAAFGQSCATDRSQLHRPALWRRDRNCGGAFRTACEAEDAGHASLMRTFVRRLVFILRTSMEVMADPEYARLQNCGVNNRAIPTRMCSRLWMLSFSIGLLQEQMPMQRTMHCY